ISKPGLHLMQCPTSHPVETLTGLGATSVEILLVCVTKTLWQTHALIPVLQAGNNRFSDDLDLIADNSPAEQVTTELFDMIIGALTHRRAPKLHGNADFQMTRGELGVSL